MATHVITTYAQALRLARIAGEDAANRLARRAGRKHWTEADYGHAVNVMNRVLGELGYSEQRPS